jgi:multicomponent Na+:H+ antiporter subunit C
MTPLTSGLIFASAGALLFVMGVAGVILLDHLLRRILAFNLMGSGVFLVLVGLAQRSGVPDPVPQAMVLTGIVVAVAATALALALARRLFKLTGGYTLPEAQDD